MTALLNAFSRTATHATLALSLHLTKHCAAYSHLYTRAMAVRTGLKRSTILGSSTAARWTRHLTRNLNFFLSSLSNLLQCDFHSHTQIGAMAYSLPSITAKATKTSEATKATKEVAKLAEDVLHRHATT